MQESANDSTHYQAPGFTVADLEESIGESSGGSYWIKES